MSELADGEVVIPEIAEITFLTGVLRKELVGVELGEVVKGPWIDRMFVGLEEFKSGIAKGLKVVTVSNRGKYIFWELLDSEGGPFLRRKKDVFESALKRLNIC